MNTVPKFLQRLALPALIVAIGVFGLTVFAAAVFFATDQNTPYVSELAFIEHSSDSATIGSVVPASCESSPPTNHFAGDCQVPPVPASITATCNTAGNNVTISYSAADRASHYAVRLDYPGDPVPHLVQNDSYGGLSYTYPVTSNTTYNAWTHACNVSGCSAPVGTTFVCPAPAVGQFDGVDANTCSVRGWSYDPDNASSERPVHIYRDGSAGAGGTFVTSCNANLARPDVNTAFGIPGNHGFDCSLPATFAGTGDHNLYIHAIDISGTPNNVIGGSPRSMRCPAGDLFATSCTIPDNQSSCNSTVAWNTASFIGGVSVSQASEFSTAASNAGMARLVTPTDRTFTLRDTGSTFARSVTVNADCSSTSIWAGGTCVPFPVINIEADPNLIRSGATAPVTIELTANYDATCTLSGGIQETFLHTASPVMQTYNRTTRPLTSANIVSIECHATALPVVTSTEEVRIEVVPTVQEI